MFRPRSIVRPFSSSQDSSVWSSVRGLRPNCW
jgi:hypothetical protein